jgi:hypothetical protein
MKRYCSLLLLLFSLLLSYKQSSGDAHLKITRLVNFPDTAVMNQPYGNIHIWVKNTGNSLFFGDVHIYCLSQSVGVIDTLRDGPYPNVFLDPGDSTSLSVNPQFSFRPAFYAAGDNIIVVWPFAAQVSNVTYESYDTVVYLVDPTGIEEVNKSSITVYPTPGSRSISINYGNKNDVERVRIYDLFGREVYAVKTAVESIDISGFRQGIYFIELTGRNGNRIIKKILVTSE